MHLSSASAAGVRFLTSVREGRGLNRSARQAGIGKETGYRWLREAYVAHRRGGKSIAETDAVMGLASAKSIAWEAEAAVGPGRHHLRVAVDTEAPFWAVYDAGTGADAAADAAGVGRSSGYRWLDRRFCELRAAGFTVKGAQRLLRLSDQVTVRAERQRAAAKLRERQAAMAAHEEALRSSCWDRPHQLRVHLVEVNPNHLLAEPNRRSFFRADGVRNPGLMACPSWTAP
jgi:transposase, IS30 family